MCGTLCDAVRQHVWLWLKRSESAREDKEAIGRNRTRRNVRGSNRRQQIERRHVFDRGKDIVVRHAATTPAARNTNHGVDTCRTFACNAFGVGTCGGGGRHAGNQNVVRRVGVGRHVDVDGAPLRRFEACHNCTSQCAMTTENQCNSTHPLNVVSIGNADAVLFEKRMSFEFDDSTAEFKAQLEQELAIDRLLERPERKYTGQCVEWIQQSLTFFLKKIFFF
jgi:hypothetical protein